MTFTNNVSHENGNKTTASIYFAIYFHFTQKSKQAFYSGLALKNLSNKTQQNLASSGFIVFFNFLFFEVFKSILFYTNYIKVIVLLNILPCNSKKTYVYTYISYK